MTAMFDIQEFLENIKPAARCDDCLSTELGIEPRQQVNQVCRPLGAIGLLTRGKGLCTRCGKTKLVSSSPQRQAAALVPNPPSTTAQKSAETSFDLEHARNDVVRVCYTIWRATQDAEIPRNISATINLLKSSDDIPFVTASLMLTVCAIRNAAVYSDWRPSVHELEVARHAAAAIESWWKANPLN